MASLPEHLLQNFMMANSRPGAFGQPPNIVQTGSYSYNSSMHGNNSAFFGPDGSAAWMDMSEEASKRAELLQAKLQQKLGPEFISQRSGAGGSRLTYVEGWKLFNIANEVFGFNGWSSQIINLQVDFCDTSPDGQRSSVCVSAVVRVTLRDGVFHEDVGCGSADNMPKKTLAFDKAKKEAVTDAVKRALRHFGNITGNCLYDKSYCNEITKVKVQPVKLDQSALHRHPDFDPNASRSSASSSKLPASAQPQPQPQQPRAGPSRYGAPSASTSTAAYPPPRPVNANQQQQARPVQPQPQPQPPQQTHRAPVPAPVAFPAHAPSFTPAPAHAPVPAPVAPPVKRETAPTPLSRQDDSDFNFDNDDDISSQDLAFADLVDCGPPIHQEEDTPIADDSPDTTGSFEPVGHSTVRVSDAPAKPSVTSVQTRPQAGAVRLSPEAAALRRAQIAEALEESAAAGAGRGAAPASENASANSSSGRRIGSSASPATKAARLAAIDAAMREIGSQPAAPEQDRSSAPIAAQHRSQAPELGYFQPQQGTNSNQNRPPFSGAVPPQKRTADGALKLPGDVRQPFAPVEPERDHDGWLKRARR